MFSVRVLGRSARYTDEGTNKMEHEKFTRREMMVIRIMALTMLDEGLMNDTLTGIVDKTEYLNTAQEG